MSKSDVRVFQLADIPLNRAGVAIVRQFNDEAKRPSAVVRVFRVNAAIDHIAFAPLVRKAKEGSYWIHEALFDEVATEPLEFGVNPFKVKGLAKRVATPAASGTYPDTGSPDAG